MCDNTQLIQALYKMKSILDDIKSHYPIDDDIQSIYTAVSTYLDTKCTHHIVFDYIDINPDSGYTIRFCDICMKTFH